MTRGRPTATALGRPSLCLEANVRFIDMLGGVLVLVILAFLVIYLVKHLGV